MNTVRRKAAKALASILSVILFGFIAFALVVLVVLPRATHGAALTVLTGSMTPTIPVGSVVVDRPVDPGTLHIGDIATYQKTAGKAEFITHRIIAINTKTTPTTFTFKGDANRGPDINPVPATAIRGKVWFSVPHLGTIRDSIQSRGMRSTVFVFGLVALVGYALFQAGSGLRERRQAPPAGPAPQPSDATLLMTFRADAFDGVDPAVVARLLRGVCADVDPTHVVLTFAGDSDHLLSLTDVLTPLGPQDVQLFDHARFGPESPAVEERVLQHA